jgi:hypothetical protein
MVSTSMQGGCTCENCSYLRVGTGNIEFAAMIAPRPLGMTGANDWTKEIETKGLPELKRHYELLGVPDRVQGRYFNFEHNYNHPSRMMMYSFFHSALGSGAQRMAERDYVPLTQAEASVWDAQHPQPASDEAAEIKLLQAFATEFDQQLATLTPKDAASLAEYRRVIGGGWDILIGRNLQTAGVATHEHGSETAKSGYREFAGLIRNTTHDEQVPTLFLYPDNWNQTLVVWLTDTGKAGLVDAGGTPLPAVAQLLQSGTAVVGIDLLYQGESLADGQPLTETRRVNNPREFLGYTVGYNHPLFAQRVHDVLSLLVAARSHQTPPSAIHLVGIGNVGPIAAAAAVQSGDAVRKLAIHTDGFRFGSITNVRDPMLLPGAVRYGDVGGLLALRAPHSLGMGEPAPSLAEAAYRAAGSNALKTTTISREEAGAAAARWLLS